MVSFQMHCKISSLRAFSSALLLLLPHLGVVLHIEHSRVGGLDVVAVDQLQQLEVEKGQELLSDVDGDWLGVGRVEPSEPRTGQGAGFGGSLWLSVALSKASWRMLGGWLVKLLMSFPFL